MSARSALAWLTLLVGCTAAAPQSDVTSAPSPSAPGDAPGSTPTGEASSSSAREEAPNPDPMFVDAIFQAKSAVVVKDGQMFGDWEWVEVPGSQCRDGSTAGYYIKRNSASDNLMIFLNGGGVCYDDFFCSINPANVDQSLPGENLLGAIGDILTNSVAPVRQVPPEAGIFLDRPENPVGKWNMVYVPYCTGDVHAGTKRDAPVFTASFVGKQQFVGYDNLSLFLEDFGAAFQGAEKVLLTGSSAGGFGTLLNFDRTQRFFSDSMVYAVSDSGIPFGDEFLEPCLQKRWRELWGLDAVLPRDCSGCFNADGGGLASGLGHYIFKEKYAGRMLGGGISTEQDEIIKLFFSSGLRECTNSALLETIPLFLGLTGYPADRYPGGLRDFVQNIAGLDSVGSYIMAGSNHQHLFRDRFYSSNGLGITLAHWLAKTLDGEAVHAGALLDAAPEPTFGSTGHNGPLKVASYTSGFRDGPDFADATIWYPDGVTGPLASVAVVPGWVSSQGDVTDWGPFLASHGFAVITIGTNSPATDLPADRERAVMDALETMRAENSRWFGPLQNKLDLTRQAVIGWSMGGGASLLAAADHPELKAAVSLCGWNPGHSYNDVTVPSLLFAGTLDALAGGQSQGFYESIPNATPRLLYEVQGGDHWVANDPAHEEGQIGRLALSWLKLYVDGDERYRKFLLEEPFNAADFRVDL
ncbi:MAG: pectin acetylesterase-family hydrolase [Myxococcales bacterium]